MQESHTQIGEDDRVVRRIADDLFTTWARARPLQASEDGIPGFDAYVPDLSTEAERAYATQLTSLAAQGGALSRTGMSKAAATTLDVVENTVQRERDLLACRSVEYTISAVMAEGPSNLLTTIARTKPETVKEGEDYLQRCSAFGNYLDTHARRVHQGAQRGAHPVASLVSVELDQAERWLNSTDKDPMTSVPAPDGLAAPEWSRNLDHVAHQKLRPALARWIAAIRSLPARPDDECGLLHIPDGVEIYRQFIRVHTTLDLDVRDLHQLGLDEVARISNDIEHLGRGLGLSGLPDVFAALLKSQLGSSAAESMNKARLAIARAEAISDKLFLLTMPGACLVEPMPEHLGRLGHAPHYTAPKSDGTAPGVFWFNTQHPDAGSGWLLEALTFHEAVPGHHLQVAKAQLMHDLPALQRYGMTTAYVEGWALYAEQLAQEAGLYTSTESSIGALCLELLRAARLVIDTGIHAYGWSRGQAVQTLATTVPLPRQFAESEVARYIASPGQALAYTVGLKHILGLREKARAATGPAFKLSTFHSTILDSGSLPLSALSRVVSADCGSS